MKAYLQAGMRLFSRAMLVVQISVVLTAAMPAPSLGGEPVRRAPLIDIEYLDGPADPLPLNPAPAAVISIAGRPDIQVWLPRGATPQSISSLSGVVVLAPGARAYVADVRPDALFVEIIAPPSEPVDLTRLLRGARWTGAYAALLREPTRRTAAMALADEGGRISFRSVTVESEPRTVVGIDAVSRDSVAQITPVTPVLEISQVSENIEKKTDSISRVAPETSLSRVLHDRDSAMRRPSGEDMASAVRSVDEVEAPRQRDAKESHASTVPVVREREPAVVVVPPSAPVESRTAESAVSASLPSRQKAVVLLDTAVTAAAAAKGTAVPEPAVAAAAPLLSTPSATPLPELPASTANVIVEPAYSLNSKPAEPESPVVVVASAQKEAPVKQVSGLPVVTAKADVRLAAPLPAVASPTVSHETMRPVEIAQKPVLPEPAIQQTMAVARARPARCADCDVERFFARKGVGGVRSMSEMTAVHPALDALR